LIYVGITYCIFVAQKQKVKIHIQIVVVQDRDRWRDLVNAVMNLGVAYNVGNF
jgi:fructose-1,6-bisphosphatase/sedoheptulose 1,7-bisphosphatase-like protein